MAKRSQRHAEALAREAELAAATAGKTADEAYVIRQEMSLQDESPAVQAYFRDIYAILKTDDPKELASVISLLGDVLTLAKQDKTLTRGERTRIRALVRDTQAFIQRKRMLSTRLRAFARRGIGKLRESAGDRLAGSESFLLRQIGKKFSPATENGQSAGLDAKANLYRNFANTFSPVEPNSSTHSRVPTHEPMGMPSVQQSSHPDSLRDAGVLPPPEVAAGMTPGVGQESAIGPTLDAQLRELVQIRELLRDEQTDRQRSKEQQRRDSDDLAGSVVRRLGRETGGAAGAGSLLRPGAAAGTSGGPAPSGGGSSSWGSTLMSAAGGSLLTAAATRFPKLAKAARGIQMAGQLARGGIGSAIRGAGRGAMSAGGMLARAGGAASRYIPRGLSAISRMASGVMGRAGGHLAMRGLGKSVAKKIPVLSIGAGLLFGAQRLMKGEYWKALGEVGSGVLGTVPGLGTAGSVALDAAMLADDVTQANTQDALTSGPANTPSPMQSPAPIALAPSTSPRRANQSVDKNAQVQLIRQALQQHGYTNSTTQANILAQVQGESNFKPRSESLNYSYDKFKTTFGSRKELRNKSDAELRRIFSQTSQQGEAALAELVYGHQTERGRALGNTQPGDGYRYRGRGYVQITGREMYQKVTHMLRRSGEDIDLINNPDLANDPTVAAKIIPLFFKIKGKSDTELQNIETVTSTVLGTTKNAYGRQKLAERTQYARNFATMPTHPTPAPLRAASNVRASGSAAAPPVIINAPSTTVASGQQTPIIVPPPRLQTENPDASIRAITSINAV